MKKKNLNNNEDNIFITEDLTKFRQSIIKELNTQKKAKTLNSFWTLDGLIFTKKIPGRHSSDVSKILMISSSNLTNFCKKKKKIINLQLLICLLAVLYLQLHTVFFFLKSLLKKSPCSLVAYQMNIYVIYFILNCTGMKNV